MTPGEREEIKKQLVDELREVNDQSRPEVVARLKSEIREDLDKDALKKEIIGEVSSKRSRVDEILKHPASLLFLGFIFTTLFGTIVTSCWKYKEWENEQDYLKTQTQCERERQTRSEEIKQKYEVKDEIIKRVAETNTAAEEILLYFLMEPMRQKREQDDRIRYWKEASRAWRINEKILRQRLLLRFEDPNVTRLFEEMTLYRGWVGININNQQERLSNKGAICRQIIDQANLCMGHVTEDLMPQVIKIMNEEIWADERNLRSAQCVTNASPETNNRGSTGTDKVENKPAEANNCKKLQQIATICDPKKKADSAK